MAAAVEEKDPSLSRPAASCVAPPCPVGGVAVAAACPALLGASCNAIGRELQRDVSEVDPKKELLESEC